MPRVPEHFPTCRPRQMGPPQVLTRLVPVSTLPALVLHLTSYMLPGAPPSIHLPCDSVRLDKVLSRLLCTVLWAHISFLARIQVATTSSDKAHTQKKAPDGPFLPAEHASAHPTDQRKPADPRQSDELSPLPQPMYHDSAGSVPAEQHGKSDLAPSNQRATHRAVRAWGAAAAAPPPPRGGGLPPDGRRMSFGATQERGVAYEPRMSFSGDVPLSPFESSIPALRERQHHLRHSVDLSSRPPSSSLSLEDAFRRERQSNRRCAFALSAASSAACHVHGGGHVHG